MQLLAIPLGVVVGVVLSRTAQRLADQLTENGVLLGLGLIVVPVVAWLAIRFAFPPVDDEPPTPTERGQRGAVAVVGAVAGLLGILLVSELFVQVGGWLDNALGSFGFLGGFLEKSGEIATAITTLLSALLGAAVFANLAGRLTNFIRSRVPDSAMQSATYPLAALSGAVIAAILGTGIGWLYRITDPAYLYWWPAATGALIGLLLAVRTRGRSTVQIGLVTYYLARTIFNSLRSIEPLVMVIVFVVWVGLGAFAGTLALAIHTVASLAKLYSEQVESISEGPIEAVKATGATRLQTIVYAVAPQIVPPYIAFTLYRWDINVRMSTIIGFAGGGGIGFVLQQNIRLLNYSAVSVNMLAIAIVVASMDYLSSRIRERVV
ncbi:MAG: ABC transporter permease subunit [Acidimicrobiia bacterium]|nr:ABC transporter permease subunit [Acidimicrobiia bacterium]